MREKYQFTNARESIEQSWYPFPSGRSRITYNAAFARRKNNFTVELYIQTPDAAANKNLFDILSKHRHEITSQASADLTWERNDGRQYSRVLISTHGDIDERDTHPQLRAWAAEWLLKFKQIFSPYLLGDAKPE
jgi:hypothetical protein